MTALRQPSLTDEATNRNVAPVIVGRITRVVFQSAKDGWAVLRLEPSVKESPALNVADSDPDYGFDSLTLVGSMDSPREGEEYEFRGCRLDTKSKYGPQWKFDSYDLRLPSTKDGIIRYLSTLVDGVGPVKAARIVGVLGDDCLQKIQSDPSILNALTWLSELQRQELSRQLAFDPILAELAGLICREGITPRMARIIREKYGDNAVTIVKDNPYLLAEELDGVGFKTADVIALQTGLDPNSPYRIQAAVKYVLKEAENDGHCYLTPNQLLGRDPADRGKERLPEVLGSLPDVVLVKEAVDALIHGEVLVRDGDAIYFREMRDAEQRVAEKIRRLAAAKFNEGKEAEIEGLIAKEELNQGVTLHAKQREAVSTTLTHGFSVLSGGPGTGKSFTTRTILSIHDSIDHTRPVYSCAPTGRAAKRLNELTGREASTIHRLLGYQPIGDKWAFAYNEDNQFRAGVLLIDEASMIDLRLMDALLSACPDDMQVVMVGDVDQLPSVGPGSVLRDIINSGAVPVVRLQYVYRQEEGSGISMFAYQVNAGEVPPLKESDYPGNDVTVVQVATPEEAADRAVEAAKEAYDRYGLSGWAVLSPMKKGPSGVANLNDRIRDVVNPAHSTQGIGLGDRVMVVKNDYSHDIYNGDVGVVVDVRLLDDGTEVLRVDFGDQFVEFSWGDEESGDKYASPNILQLAFSSTVHKVQGSEFPVSIVVLTRSHWHMLARNLAYTACTRAKKRLVVICQVEALKQAVRNDRIAERNSKLAERLSGRVGQ
jgi:exodeoxyribonuclease V alpha subunit